MTTSSESRPGALREPGQLLGAIFSASPDAIVVVDASGTIVLSSPATTELFGYYPEELVGASIASLLPMARRDVHDRHIAHFFADPHARQMGEGLELAGRHRDGSEFPVDVSLAPVEVRGGRYAAAFVRDARERQRAIEQLHAVNDVSQRLLSGSAVDAVLPVVAGRARELNGADATWIVLPHRDGDLEIVAVDGPGTEVLLGVRLSGETSRSAVTMRTRASEVIADLAVAGNVPDAVKDLDLGPGLYSPLSSKDRSLGTLVVARVHGSEPFAPIDVAVTEVFASAIATAVELGEARAEVERLGIVAEDERIARDLHDTVIQRLFAIGMSLQATVGLLDGTAQVRIEAAMDELDAVIKEIRNTIFRLPGRSGDDRGLRDELLGLADRAKAQLGFSPRLLFEGPVELGVGPELARNLVNVLGEALSNVARHAGATSVDAIVALADGQVTLTVADDGVGISDSPSAGNGLRNLRERAESCGGSFALRPRAPRGTVLEWSAPI